jgi:surface protein
MLEMFSTTNFGGFPISTASWGTTGALTNVVGMFQGSTNCPSMDLTGLIKAGCTSMENMFASSSITSTNVTGWDTSTVTDMGSFLNLATTTTAGMFGEENWDTSKVTNMGSAFRNTNTASLSVGNWNTSSLVSLAAAWQSGNSPSLAVWDVALWDVSKVTTMAGTFRASTIINGPFNVSLWNTASLMDTSTLFQFSEVGTGPFASIPWDVSNWNLQNLRTIAQMCEGAGSTSKPPIMSISTWNNLPMLMTANRAFYQCKQWNPLVDNWNAPMLNNIQEMLALSNSNPDITTWSMGSLSIVTNAFHQCYMTKANYNTILLKFATETSLNSRNIGSPYDTLWTPNTNPGTLQKYSDSTSRATLISRSWTITDGGFEA